MIIYLFIYYLFNAYRYCLSLSHISCQSHVSLSLVSFLMPSVCLMSLVCLTSPVCLMSTVCLTSPVCFTSPVSFSCLSVNVDRLEGRGGGGDGPVAAYQWAGFRSWPVLGRLREFSTRSQLPVKVNIVLDFFKTDYELSTIRSNHRVITFLFCSIR